MARRRTRARTRRSERNGVGPRRNSAAAGGVDVSVVPRALLGAVNGVEIVAVGALQFARDVLLSAVSGAANIGAEALAATTAGARGVVSATSQMVGDIAGTAESAFRDALNNARHSRPGAPRVTLGRPALAVDRNQDERGTVPSTATPRSRRTRRPRPIAGQTRTGMAA